MTDRPTTPATAITITLPLPSQSLYPNARKHWKAKMKPKKQQRTDAYHAARAAIVNHYQPWSGPRWELAECQATFYLQRRRDSDNLLAWLKATFDGLQDAGIVGDDGNFIHLPVQQITAKAAKGRREVVLVIIERKG